MVYISDVRTVQLGHFWLSEEKLGAFLGEFA